MTPLFDMTITNIKLATHGQVDAMNAVLISSIAASTFNTQLEAWEPLVEPFDGIFKYDIVITSHFIFCFIKIYINTFLYLNLRFETYDTNANPPSKLGKRVRIAATSILNVNVSAASLETFVGSVLSWRRQLELEQKAFRQNEVSSSRDRFWVHKVFFLPYVNVCLYRKLELCTGIPRTHPFLLWMKMTFRL